MKPYRVEYSFPLGIQQQWRIVFKEEPSLNDVEAVIEKERPYAGYGPSSHRTPKLRAEGWEVQVLSWASCD